MILYFLSAGLAGLFHSMTPNHWLPVVLMAKTRKWSVQTALLGATLTALGHILVSIFIGLGFVWVGVQFRMQDGGVAVEKYAGLMLAVFGLIYAAFTYKRHSHCVGHTHHGPDPKQGKGAPLLFLFTIGFSPCLAVLPVFTAAAAEGYLEAVFSMVGYSVGVLFALVSATLLASIGIMKLDHPIIEHYGDVITGVAVAMMGFWIYFAHHHHHH